MPVDYNPKDASKTWPVAGPDGKPIEYQAVLINVEDSVSKRKPDGSGGNPMQVWTWRSTTPRRSKQVITDYVAIPAAVFKIKQLARALGQEEQFKAGQFQADDHVRSTFAVTLVIEEQDGYDDKNKIGKYLPANKVQQALNTPPQQRRQQIQAQPVGVFAEEEQFKEDDIPF
jgi:hypothetical protein